MLTVKANTNTDDDIYHDDTENGDTNRKSGQKIDNTTANTILPYTGRTTILIIIGASTLIASVMVFRYRKFKDIK